MLSAGIIVSILGAISLIYGFIQNNSFEAMLKANSYHPGLIYIIIGAIALFVGIVMILVYINKNKNKHT